MTEINTEQMIFSEVQHLPIVKEYAKRLSLVETIDQMVDSQMALSPGEWRHWPWSWIPFQGAPRFTGFHRLTVAILKVPKFGRGSPSKDRSRTPARHEYVLKASILEAPEKVAPFRFQAGCFVLLSNLIDQEEGWPAPELATLYKSQIGVEKNFSFLKAPLIVNSIFLKKAERIEVPGLVLLISLLIWRLMERSMRQYIAASDCTLAGWEKRPTRKPTAFMMTTKFAGMLVITIGSRRQLARPLKDYQRQYLDAMGVTEDIFTGP